jgi:predicted secreted protein
MKSFIHTLNEDDNGHTFTIEKDSEFILKLKENPCTGYLWTTPLFDDAVIAMAKDEFISPDTHLNDACGAIGGGGSRVWTFTTLKSGVSSVLSYYKQSFAKDKLPAEIFGITIIIP